MARFSFPFVQLAAAAGAAAMVAFGQWLGAREAARPEPEGRAQARIELGMVDARSTPPRSAAAMPASQNSTDADAVSGGSARPRLSVIIDDVGHDPALARALMTLPVTLAVLPYAAAAPQIAAEARTAGREVFIHLPMEPAGLDDPGPGAVTTGLGAAEIEARIDRALARVPGAAGLNNHMGSRATRDVAVMEAVFASLAGSELVFVDSLTHPGSLAREAALGAGLAAFDRDIFLDSPGADPAVQLEMAILRALETGRAIAIGHPYPATIEALESLQGKADAAGVDLVPVADLAARRAPPS
ncbi:MAG: divergent polysaccharide deacetylase family protein [Oceanicaulis sp.]